MRFFKKHKWSKWQDVALITSGGHWKLLQVSECELTGKKRYHQIKLGWVNDYTSKQNIIDKTNIKK